MDTGKLTYRKKSHDLHIYLAHFYLSIFFFFLHMIIPHNYCYFLTQKNVFSNVITCAGFFTGHGTKLDHPESTH